MRYYTMKDITILLGISKNTLINWEEAKKIAPAKREAISGYRFWTDAEFEQMRELAKEIKGRVLQQYRGQKIIISCPKEGHWKYQNLIFDEQKIKAKISKEHFPTKEKALEEAKESIDVWLAKKS